MKYDFIRMKYDFNYQFLISNRDRYYYNYKRIFLMVLAESVSTITTYKPLARLVFVE